MDFTSRFGRKSIYFGVAGIALAAGAFAFLQTPARLAAQDGSFVRGGKAGFVVTHFAYALGPDHKKTGACSDGMSKNVVEIFQESPEGARRPGEGDEAYSKRLEMGGRSISATPDGKNFCMHPELAAVDVHARALTSAAVRADGIDLDGADSRSGDDVRSGRLDFVGLDGTKGVDNQFWRAVGCTRSFQEDGPSNGFEVEMYTGSWGILIVLDDLDDLKNDDHVKVGIHANADPIQLSPTREALDYATYAMDRETGFRANTTGKIVNGQLTTEPVDVQFHSVVNAMHLVRSLRRARVRATLSPDGTLKGYLGGFAGVEDHYNQQFAFRNATNADGTPSLLARRLNSSNGAGRVLGYTCQGMYQALYRLADGDRDPKTGKFTSISTQYRFEARPAFVVDVPTRSKNEALTSR